MSQRLRAKGLTQAYFDAKEVNADVNRQLKAQRNKSFGQVAIMPVPDLPPPKPVMQNVGLTFMILGLAIGEGI